PGDVGVRPLGSNLNFKAGDAPTANQVIVRVGVVSANDGTFWVYNHAGSVDVVIDVNGYFIEA
ncbi:MAG: hypothetical protein ACKPBG_10480, partial [Actinomycetota bacterium]